MLAWVCLLMAMGCAGALDHGCAPDSRGHILDFHPAPSEFGDCNTRPRQVSEEDRRRFRDDGIVVMENFFSDEEVAAFQRVALQTEDAPENTAERDGVWKYFNLQSFQGQKERKVLDRVEHFLDSVDGWSSLLRNGSRVQAVGSELLGEQAVLWKEKINLKKPGSDGFQAHQYVQAGWLESGQTVHVSVMVSIDAMTVENGCLEIVRGMNKQGFLGPLGKKLPDTVESSMKWERVLTTRKSIVVFDAFVPHRSKPNFSQGQRRGLFATYIAESEASLQTNRQAYYDKKRSTFPPDSLKEAGRNYPGYQI